MEKNNLQKKTSVKNNDCVENDEIENKKKSFFSVPRDIGNILFYVILLIVIILLCYYFYFCSSKNNIIAVQTLNEPIEQSLIIPVTDQTLIVRTLNVPIEPVFTKQAVEDCVTIVHSPKQTVQPVTVNNDSITIVQSV